MRIRHIFTGNARNATYHRRLRMPTTHTIYGLDDGFYYYRLHHNKSYKQRLTRQREHV